MTFLSEMGKNHKYMMLSIEIDLILKSMCYISERNFRGGTIITLLYYIMLHNILCYYYIILIKYYRMKMTNFFYYFE